MDCSLSGSSIHGIFQARVLEWLAISFSRGSSWPRNRTQVSLIAGRRFTVCNSGSNSGDPGSIPGSGRSPEEGIGYPFRYSWASLVAQTTKIWPAMRETWVWPLGWKDRLEEFMATHSSILAWRIPWMEEPGRLQSIGLHRDGHD